MLLVDRSTNKKQETYLVVMIFVDTLLKAVDT